MPKYDVVSVEKKKVGQIDLSDKVFSTDVNIPLMHEAVQARLANKRLGTASTKDRSEVKGSGVKPYRQKGTGRARHGSWQSPLFVGGGITFGPKPRDYSLKINKKKKGAALRSALSSKVKDGKLLIIDRWVEKKKTKDMAHIFEAMGINSALIVVEEPIEWLERTTNNIPHINVISRCMLNTYDVLVHSFLICTKEVVAKIEEGLEQ